MNKEDFLMAASADGTFRYTIATQSKYAGCYQIGGDNGLQIWFKNKPIWLHRKMAKLLLGWEWVDNK